MSRRGWKHVYEDDPRGSECLVFLALFRGGAAEEGDELPSLSLSLSLSPPFSLSSSSSTSSTAWAGVCFRFPALSAFSLLASSSSSSLSETATPCPVTPVMADLPLRGPPFLVFAEEASLLLARPTLTAAALFASAYRGSSALGLFRAVCLGPAMVNVGSKAERAKWRM